MVNVIIGVLQKVKEESERVLQQLNTGSSRIYEISTAGTIVERTYQLRDFYLFVSQQVGQVILLLGSGGVALDNKKPDHLG